MDSAYHANPQRKSSLKEISPEDLRMLTSKHGGRPHVQQTLATLHDNEEYGYLAVYLRLRNLVPPSTNSR